jgi:hypothetical protein
MISKLIANSKRFFSAFSDAVFPGVFKLSEHLPVIAFVATVVGITLQHVRRLGVMELRLL